MKEARTNHITHTTTLAALFADRPSEPPSIDVIIARFCEKFATKRLSEHE